MEREEKRNNSSVIIVAFLCAALFGIAVAYAALGASLEITFNRLSQDTLTWNVGFEPGVITGAKTGSTNAVCGDATATANTVTVADTTLTTLHDKCVYHLTIKNTGSVAANLETISAKTPQSVSCNTSTISQMVCGNTTYKLTTDSAGQTLLGTGNVLAATNGSLDVYLTVEYTGETTGGSNVDQINGGFNLIYKQS